MGLDVRGVGLGKFQLAGTDALTSAGTTMDVDGLDLSTDAEYYFLTRVKNETAGAGDLRSLIKTSVGWETTLTDYYTQKAIFTGAVSDVNRVNTNYLMTLPASDYATVRGWIVNDDAGHTRIATIGENHTSSIQNTRNTVVFKDTDAFEGVRILSTVNITGTLKVWKHVE